ncbi:MAG: AAA family ATPase [Candidatus Acidiferrales bacterium]
MRIRVITVEREYGSGGASIARQLASRLGWKLWDEELTAEIARVANVDHRIAQRCDERVDSLLSRLFRVYARGSYERALPLPEAHGFDTDRMFATLHKVIEDVGSRGDCVIVGRGSPFILRERADVFRVFIYAPIEEKMRRVKALGKSEQEARQLVEEVDRERASFIRHYFGKEWPHRPLYHAMFNSQHGDERVVEMILEYVEAFDRHSASQAS